MEKYWWYKTDWHQKTLKALKVAGMGERTQECYTRAMRMLVEHFNKTPDLITEDELIDYFVFRRDETRWSPATIRICYSGIKFFFANVLQKPWHVFSYAKSQREKRLPSVLSKEEIRTVFAKVRPFHNYAYLMTVYTCGLRLQEGLYLEVSDIDGQRNMVHVHRGKGAKDRYVPLPESTYALLRRYRLTHRHKRLIFPAMGRGGQDGPTAERPMSIEGVQGAFRKAEFAASIRKKRVSVHTLRHYVELDIMGSKA
ncbi:MAG: site-specific integrase [Thermodesulfobacteriota bacterium]|nr:site-specific integrase [Thermodesulfobacteriota bacterium]